MHSVAQLSCSTIPLGSDKAPTPTTPPTIVFFKIGFYMQTNKHISHTSNLKLSAVCTSETLTSPTSTWCDNPRTELILSINILVKTQHCLKVLGFNNSYVEVMQPYHAFNMTMQRLWINMRSTSMQWRNTYMGFPQNLTSRQNSTFIFTWFENLEKEGKCSVCHSRKQTTIKATIFKRIIHICNWHFKITRISKL
jgi:hypothetical protein